MIIIILLALTFTFLIFPSHTHAFVIIPAVVLIPIAKMVAIVVGSFLLPITGVGVAIQYIAKNKKLAIIISLTLLLLITVIAFIILKFLYPDNPLF